MKKIKFTFLIVSIFFASFIPNSAFAQKVKVKLFVWNVLAFETEDKSGEEAGFPVSGFTAFIQNHNPDIICLNEFETGTSRMGKEKMAELASILNMYPYFIMSYPKDVGFYGNVILSKYPIINTASKLHEYEHYKGEGNYQFNDGWQAYYYGADQRSVGYADILIPTSDSEGEIIRVGTSHFDHQGSEILRTEQSEQSVDFIGLDDPKYPTIFAGDFNTMSNSTLSPIFEHGDQVGYSWVDHIFTFPKGKWTNEGFITIPAGNLSDHNAIIATLSIN